MTSTPQRGVRAQRRITDPPSMAVLATDTVRELILSGELAPGDRIVEQRLADELGVSRPPLREALTALRQEGLVELLPRRGAVVRALTLHDVFEIVTMRTALEQLVVQLGVPVRDPARLAALEDAVRVMEEHAGAGSESEAVSDSHRFHLALVGLAGHHRLEESYRALGNQLRLYLDLNRRARAATESLVERAARHRHLVDLVAAGDPAAVLAALDDPAQLTYVVEHGERLGGATPEALAWLDGLRHGTR